MTYMYSWNIFVYSGFTLTVSILNSVQEDWEYCQWKVGERWIPYVSIDW